MFKKLMLKLGYVHFKDIEHEINLLDDKFKNKVPSVKYKDGTKNTIFFAERTLMNEFRHDLNDLKIIFEYYSKYKGKKHFND